MAENYPHLETIERSIVAPGMSFKVAIEPFASLDDIYYRCTIWPLGSTNNLAVNEAGAIVRENAGEETYIRLNGEGEWEDDYQGVTETSKLIGSLIESYFE